MVERRAARPLPPGRRSRARIGDYISPCTSTSTSRSAPGAAATAISRSRSAARCPRGGIVDVVLREWRAWQSHPAWDGSPRVDTRVLRRRNSLAPRARRHRPDLIERFRARRAIAAGAEVTLEANPDDVTPAAAAAWRAAGVNRVSLGVQSFDASVLRWMHRTHTRRTGRPPRWRRSAPAGIADLSLDLIFGLPAALGPRLGSTTSRPPSPRRPITSRSTASPSRSTPRWPDGRRGARWRRSTRSAMPPSSSRRTRRSRPWIRALRGIQRRPSRPARAAQRRRTGGARRSSGSGPSAHSGLGRSRRWNVRDWSAYDRAISEGRSVVAGEEELSRRGRGAGGGLPGSPDRPRASRPSGSPRGHRGLDRAGLGARTRRTAPAHARRLAATGCVGGVGECVAARVAPAISAQDSAQRRQISEQAAM